MSTLRILVADDHAVVRRGLRALLEGHEGWKVCAEATTGWEAVEQARALQPEVAVVDITMPELNGLDATSLILKASPQTRVLILTVHESDQIADKILRSGALGFVLKSDAERDLIAALEAVSRGQPFFTSVAAQLMLQRVRGGPQLRGGYSGRELTVRERQIVQLVAEGRSNKEIAARLHLSVRTIESHRANVMEKLDLHSLSDLVRYAVKNLITEA